MTEKEILVKRIEDLEKSIKLWTKSSLQSRAYAHRLEAVLESKGVDYLNDPVFMAHVSPLERVLGKI